MIAAYASDLPFCDAIKRAIAPTLGLTIRISRASMKLEKKANALIWSPNMSAALI